MNLHGFVGDVVQRLGAEHLHDRRLDVVLLEHFDQRPFTVLVVGADLRHRRVDQPGRAVAHRFADVDLHRHARELLLNHAEARQRLAELLSVLGVLRRGRQDLLRPAHDGHAEAQPPNVEDVERDLVTPSLFAEQVAFRNAHVVVGQRARR